MVESYAVEGVFQRENALDFVRLYHRDKYVAEGGRRLGVKRRKRSAEGGKCRARGFLAADPIGDGENRAEIIRRVAPFSGEPRVVEIEPANKSADVESRLNGIEFVIRARDARTVDDAAAGHDRTEQLGARGIR